MKIEEHIARIVVQNESFLAFRYIVAFIYKAIEIIGIFSLYISPTSAAIEFCCCFHHRNFISSLPISTPLISVHLDSSHLLVFYPVLY